MTKINVGIELPKDAVTQALAFLGRRGTGKTYAASKFAEELYGIGAQFVIIDPVGVWWGLRLAADGKSAGIPIPVFGGLHGDIPLEPSAGKLMADLIVDKGISAILDISQFEHNSEKTRFASDFAARFFFKKKSSPSAVHLFLEESQEVVPQNPAKGEEPMLGAFERLIKLGRNFGIGISLISQRCQEINKKALNQTECVFAFQMTGVHERKAIEAWIADKGIDEDISAILPKLEVGEARIWSPQWLKISKTIHIPKKTTYNASSTPEVGASVKKTNTLAQIDLEKIRGEMKATIDKAQAEDPKVLQKKIRELQLALKQNKPIVSVDEKAIERAHQRGFKEAESSYLGVIKKIESQNKVVSMALANIESQVKNAQKVFEMVIPTVKPMVQPKKIMAIARFGMSEIIPTRVLPSVPTQTRQTSEETAIEKLNRCEKAIYSLLYNNLGKDYSKQNVALFTNYSNKSGGFNNSVYHLSALGLIKRSGEMLSANPDQTSLGEELLGKDINLHEEFTIENWERKLPKCEREIFKFLMENQQEFSKEEIAEQTGYSAGSGGFNNAIYRLNSLGLIKRQSNSIRINEEMFEK